MVHFGEFLKTEACGQTVLPDRSLLIGQKLVENAKITKHKFNILSDFQTLCKKSNETFLLIFKHCEKSCKEIRIFCILDQIIHGKPVLPRSKDLRNVVFMYVISQPFNVCIQRGKKLLYCENFRKLWPEDSSSSFKVKQSMTRRQIFSFVLYLHSLGKLC